MKYPVPLFIGWGEDVAYLFGIARYAAKLIPQCWRFRVDLERRVCGTAVPIADAFLEPC